MNRSAVTHTPPLRELIQRQKIFEVILLCGFYRTIAYLANALDLPLEANVARFPRSDPA